MRKSIFFVLCKFKDLGRLVTRVFQHFTDFGEINITHNSSGRVGLHLKGGADFINETHPLKARWTVQAWLGDHPGSETDRLHVMVNDPGNNQRVELSFTTEGKVFLKTTSDKTEQIGADHITEVTGNKSLAVKGDHSETVDGNRSTVVSGKEEVVFLSGKTEVVTGACTLACSSFNLRKL